jgi:flagellar motor switch/type III secretory pathway protein FliN
MITTKNYFQKIETIQVNKLPETLRKSHEFVLKSSASGSTWEAYENNQTVHKVIDLYLEKLNQYLASQSETEQVKTPDRANKDQAKIKQEPKEKVSAFKKTGRKVEHIREEVKFIKRFVGLHNKIKSPNSILSLIKGLQRSIVQKLIRKTSPLAREIQMIQDKLITLYNSMKGDLKIEINDKDLSRLVVIAGGEEVYPSINIIKRYVGMQGKEIDQGRISAFHKQIESAIGKEKVSSDDPYYDKVKAIHNTIKKLKAGQLVNIGKAELNGLEGIVKACNCKTSIGKIYDTGGKELRPCQRKTYSDSKNNGACSHNQGLNGVLTAEEMANRKLDLLNFTSFWQSLFGTPAKNFTMMFHGEPHNGKTILLLKLAQYLAENFGSVLYVSSEEYASTTMTDKVNDFLNPFPKRLHFVESLQDVDLSQYEFVILDSVNDLGLNINQYKEIRKENPDIAFILILQHTKAGAFRGGKDWEHKAEIVGEVNKGTVTLTKNRYGSKNSLEFFHQFGLQWQEPKQIPTKPLQLRNDMVTDGDTHY